MGVVGIGCVEVVVFGVDLVIGCVVEVVGCVGDVVEFVVVGEVGCVDFVGYC